jgi:DNA-binding NarL/FixJ family response regulator
MKILITENDPHVRLLLKELMEALTDDILESADGMDAVLKYEKYRPDFVLMDIRMPRMDGIEATERIMAMDPCAKILIVTQHGQQAYRDAAKKAGAAAYVLKDDLTTLPERIRKAHFLNINAPYINSLS